MNKLDLDGLTDAQLRLFAVRCARRVQHLMTDSRSLAVLDVAERHAKGEATDEELATAKKAAQAAAWPAAMVPYTATAAAGWASGVRVAETVREAAAWAAEDARNATALAARSAELAAQRETLAQIRTETTP